MSVRVMHLVWKYGCPMAEKIVLLKLADCGNDQGESIYPKKESVASDCGCTVRHVQAVIEKYVRMDVLAVAQQGGGRGNPTVYTLDPNALNPEPQSLNALQTVNAVPLKGEPQTLKGEPHANDTLYRKSDEPLGNRDTRARPSSLEEVAEYMRQIEVPYPLEEAGKFWDYRESNGWKVGQNAMKDWKASVRYWKRNIKPARGKRESIREANERLGDGA